MFQLYKDIIHTLVTVSTIIIINKLIEYFGSDYLEFDQH